ncbi:hypothetical protein [Rhodococcus phage REQ1]|uniref:nucleotide kinase n=1 Tax=Rhodococcus phage REQ1 TaxID=1109712 RepID=UPI00023EEC03|nr:nucleotide kinase [Rhodococcus phage REQ1]AEV52030.1 hypothetical protein [Rhodococcus phage REQ1]
MRNSTAPDRKPKFCQFANYTPGKGAVGCTFRNEHDGKHSYEVAETDEEGDMRSCDGSDICKADFHHPACRGYQREQIQSGPYHAHVDREGVLRDVQRAGSRIAAHYSPDSRELAVFAPETLQYVVGQFDERGIFRTRTVSKIVPDGFRPLHWSPESMFVLHTQEEREPLTNEQAAEELVSKLRAVPDPVDEDEDMLTVDHDAVHHPSHYRTIPATIKHPNGIEAIDVTRWFPFAEGNVLKYLLRAGHKGDRLEDLRKARQYLDFAIEFEEEARTNKGENDV